MANIAILVLGDIGRSPRMQYHARSLAENGHKVSIVGYEGEECIEEVRNNPKITRYYLRQYFKDVNRKYFLFYAPIKVLLQIIFLFYTLLFEIPTPDAILVQNPPSIPSLFVAWVVCRLKSSKLIIDWHNFGYTILKLRFNNNENHILVRIAKWFERVFGSKGDYHICVTKAMKDWLKKNWNIEATVLYDKPPDFFKHTMLYEMHNLLVEIHSDLSDEPIKDPRYTIATHKIDENTYGYNKDRPALLVSSTSWTADEDFGILFDAFVKFDDVIEKNPNKYPNILCIITGKGDLRDEYMKKVEKQHFKHITIKSVWLSPKNYPLVLGSCDLGVSLHNSSSGYDLPMKVVDMFGSDLPVCAMRFNCIEELVVDNKNGLLFDDSESLEKCFENLLSDFPNNKLLTDLHEGVKEFKKDDWRSNWNKNVKKLFD